MAKKNFKQLMAETQRPSPQDQKEQIASNVAPDVLEEAVSQQSISSSISYEDMALKNANHSSGPEAKTDSKNTSQRKNHSAFVLKQDVLTDEQKRKFEEIVKKIGMEAFLQAKRLVDDSVQNIIKRKAFFKENDIKRGALFMAQKEVDKKILEHKEFVDAVEWCIQAKPLVTIGHTGSLTTHEMWELENLVLDLAGEEHPQFVQPQDIVEEAIQRKTGISQEQKDAVYAACLSPKRITVIEGTAGAGKSFTMEAVKETYMAMGYDVIGTALGWNAAKVLGDSAKLEDEKCVAIEGLTRGWLAARARGAEPFQGPTLVIVDEAGMVGTRHMAIILEETRRSRYPVKVVLTGDSLQVIPVDAGNALEAIIHFYGTTRIETIRRQHQPSHRRAVKKLSEQKSGHALNSFMNQECLRWCKNKDTLMNMVTRNYISYRLAHPNKKALVLAYANKDILELNRRIRAVYKKLGMIGQDDVVIKTTDGKEVFESSFSVGDEVLLRANDKNMMVYEIDESKSPLKPETWKPIRLGVFNRNPGRIVAMRRSDKPLGSYDFVVDITGDVKGRVVINSDTFKHSDKDGMPMVHNYSGTIYGSQGQTVNHVLMIDNPQMDFRLAYVGMSRHKETVEVYLDETELHRRLDKALGRRQSLESRVKMDKQGKSIEDATVDLGRWNRSEMLRAVSLTWGKYSENLCALIYEEHRRLGQQKIKLKEEELAKIQPEKPDEIVIDYLPEFNQSYPLIDVEKILMLEDPVLESELVRPSDVEVNKQKYGMLEMPVDPEATPMPLPTRTQPKRRENIGVLPTQPEEESGFFNKAFGWLVSKPVAEKSTASPAPILRQNSPVSAFEDLEGLAPEPEETLTEEVLKKLNQWMRPKPKIDIPYATNHALCGQVIRPPAVPEEKDWREQGILDTRPYTFNFDGVPQVLNVEGGPKDEFLSSQFRQMWDIGRFEEPRILSRNAYGQVVARYRLNGECVVGEGFPPIWVNRQGRPNGPVYIVAGAKEWFWLRETMEEKYKDAPHQIPHIIWAAKDMDWALIGPSLKNNEKVIVVRSKSDHRQIPWALQTQEMLSKRFGVSSQVSPKIDVESECPQSIELPDFTPLPESIKDLPQKQNMPLVAAVAPAKESIPSGRWRRGR